MRKFTDYSERDDHVLVRAHRIVQDRFYIMRWSEGAIPTHAYIYDSVYGNLRLWVRGFTYKEWRCWLTDELIPPNPTGDPNKPGWAWRYSTPRFGVYPDGTPRRDYQPGEERIRVNAILFDRWPDTGTVFSSY